MIYALEWYDIPRKSYSDLVEFHPYLTNSDFDKLSYLNMQHYTENTVFGFLSFIVCNRLINSSSRPLMKQKFVRWPCALLSGAFLTFICNRLFLRKLYLEDLKELGLTRYFELDLNADLMKNDLKEIGIEIKAKHFNFNEI